MAAFRIAQKRIAAHSPARARLAHHQHFVARRKRHMGQSPQPNKQAPVAADQTISLTP
jgi:hypothetical protein